MTVGGRNSVGGSLRVHGDSTGFVEVDVGTRVEDDGVRGLLEVGANGELVGLWAKKVRTTPKRLSDIHTMVPLTQNNPASLPASLAMRSWRSLVAWSSCSRANKVSEPLPDRLESPTTYSVNVVTARSMLHEIVPASERVRSISLPSRARSQLSDAAACTYISSVGIVIVSL